MATVVIDGREITISDRRQLNGIQAARLAGVEIPHYCWHPALSVVGSCRMCLVEVGRHDGKTGQVVMNPRLEPACKLTAVDGMVLVTNSEKVVRARAMVEEDLLLRHPIDCPICDKAGECLLQDYHFAHGQDERRADIRPITSRKRDLGDVQLFIDRCVLCSRCVRFAREISGTRELLVTGRSADAEIDVVAGFPLQNNLSGNVVDLCPVGALADKEFLYKQRVWFLRKHQGVCPHCAVGCSIWIDENQDRIYRIRPRENPQVNRWWICNEGRWGYPHVHNPARILQPVRRENGSAQEADWSELPAEITTSLKLAGHLAAVISPFLTVEEAYLLCRYIRSLDPSAVLAAGPAPVRGEDEHFPGGFQILAEKCPNRRGTEAVIARFTGGVMDFGKFVGELNKGAIGGVWVSGGYPYPWIDPPLAARFEQVRCLVVQDLFPSPLSQMAHYELPAAAFAEREGSYVNRADRLQFARRAIRPPQGLRVESGLFWELLRRPGLFDARKVLDDLARDNLTFAAATAEIPETGLDLRVNLLAEGGKNPVEC